MKIPGKQIFITAALGCAVAPASFAQDTKKEKQQMDVRETAHKTLQQLYKAERMPKPP
jgi:hypothetical protein